MICRHPNFISGQEMKKRMATGVSFCLSTQRLLLRYGSDLVLMDTTYKTTKYRIPLFLMCVHTNVGYKVVAKFLCRTKTKNVSQKLIKIWNPMWKPIFTTSIRGRNGSSPVKTD